MLEQKILPATNSSDTAILPKKSLVEKIYKSDLHPYMTYSPELTSSESDISVDGSEYFVDNLSPNYTTGEITTQKSEGFRLLDHQTVRIDKSQQTSAGRTFYFDVSPQLQPMTDLILVFEVRCRRWPSLRCRGPSDAGEVFSVAREVHVDKDKWRVSIGSHTQPKLIPGRWSFRVFTPHLMGYSSFTVSAKLTNVTNCCPWEGNELIISCFEFQRWKPFVGWHVTQWTDFMQTPCKDKSVFHLPDFNWSWATPWQIVPPATAPSIPPKVTAAVKETYKCDGWNYVGPNYRWRKWARARTLKNREEKLSLCEGDEIPPPDDSKEENDHEQPTEKLRENRHSDQNFTATTQPQHIRLQDMRRSSSSHQALFSSPDSPRLGSSEGKRQSNSSFSAVQMLWSSLGKESHSNGSA